MKSLIKFYVLIILNVFGDQ